MPQMCAAQRAFHFPAHHTQANVHFFVEIFRRNRFPETRPAGSGLEFRVGGKQSISTANASKYPHAMLVRQIAAFRRFRPRKPRHPVRIHGQLLFPFVPRFSDFLARHSPQLHAVVVKLDDRRAALRRILFDRLCQRVTP